MKAPSPLGLSPKTTHHSPTTTTSVAPREEEVTLQEVPFLWAPLRLVLSPLEALSCWWCCRGDLPSPVTSFSSHSCQIFKQVNLKGKIHICKWCTKQTSNWESMVSNCLQENLGICLVCPQCGMSYSDPLSSISMAGGSIICCFIK